MNKFKTIKKLCESLDQKVISFLFEGPPGCGKTWTAMEVGNALKCKIFKIDGSPGIGKEDIEGFFQAKGKDIEFVPGKLIQAIKWANNAENKTKTAMILVNEFTLLHPSVQGSFNALLDFQAEINCSLNATTYKVNEGSKLIFIATTNIALAGLHSLQESVRDRFEYHLHFDYPSVKKETSIYKPYASRDIDLDNFVSFIREVRKLYTEDNKLDIPISPRSGIAFLNAMKKINRNDALNLTIIQKVTRDSVEQATIKRLAEGKDIFKEIYVKKENNVEDDDIEDIFEENDAEDSEDSDLLDLIPIGLRPMCRLVDYNELEYLFKVRETEIKSRTVVSVELSDGKIFTPGTTYEGFDCVRRAHRLILNKVDEDTARAIKIEL